MTTYQYLYSDFLSTTTASDTYDLKLKILNLGLASTLTGIGSINEGVNRIVNITFSTALSGGNKTTLDTLIGTYTDPSLATICSIKDIKAVGTNGGTFNKDVWTTRDLNVVEGDVTFLTLSNNIITIEPGSYIIDIRAPTCEVKNNQIRLRNITESSYSLGTNAFSDKGQMTISTLHDLFIFTVQTQFDIQHICSSTSNSIGFGRASGYATNEVYTSMFIQKID